ncbi:MULTISPECIES: DUF982 domain-containing protein [Mesorhizobium]|uniref:DUF982 domain-containing protein n=1 Tax=Mesorhizobium cantuariense TaxID=1300275 RepID=A0ABV7MIS3_9HYPH|nr:DUF982 domain-containing protein [Mesorhizobium sophorae]
MTPPVSLHRFSPPVVINTSTPGIRYECSSVEDAADQLLQWTKHGPRWNEAVRVCLSALAGELTPADARIAFKAAAREEGLLV